MMARSARSAVSTFPVPLFGFKPLHNRTARGAVPTTYFPRVQRRPPLTCWMNSGSAKDSLVWPSAV